MKFTALLCAASLALAAPALAEGKTTKSGKGTATESGKPTPKGGKTDIKKPTRGEGIILFEEMETI